MKKIRTCITLLFLLIISNSLFAQAPTVSYATPKVYAAGSPIATLTPTSTGVAAPGYSGTPIVLGSGFSQPAGVAVDAAGNIFVACYGSSTIAKIAAGTGTITTVGSGFHHPNDVKVDAAGNIYVADQGNNAVKKIPVGGGSIVTLASGLGSPSAISVDAAGNVYVADPGYGLVRKLPVGGAPAVNLGSFNNPFGVAVDGQGVVYATDATGGLYQIPPGGGAFPEILSGLINPNGMWIDASGNIFITDTGNDDGTGGFVKELPAGGGALVTVPFTFQFPFEVTTDLAGNIYVGDPDITTIQEMKVTGGYFINPTLPPGLSFNSTTGAISGTPTASSPATTYTITAYNASGHTSATVNIKVVLPAAATLSYATPQTYTSGSAITPLSPTKTGVAALGYSNSPIVLGSGFSGPEGVAVDAAGNVYVCDAIQNKLMKIPAGNGTPVVVASGFNLLADVAIDKSGNLYVTDYFNNEIKEFVGGTGTPVVLGSGFYHPYGVAVDAAGNVYVGDQGNNMVKKIPVGNKPVVVLASGLYIPDDLCVDAAGNVYFADLGNNAIKKIPAGGGLPVSVGTGFVQPLAVAVDAAGNLFVTDRNNNAIKEIYAGTNTTVTISAGFNFPFGICVDPQGDVFVGDYGNQQVKEIKPIGGYFINALPQGLSFAESTGVLSGTPTAVSPATNYTVTAYNIGGSKQATVNIGVTAPPAASALSALTLSNSTLSPAFTTGTTAYAASVVSTVLSTTVTPTVTTAGATVKVNGTTVASGTASAAIPLAIGANTITIVVTASGGTSTTTYKVVVTRQLPNNANLSGITLSSGTLSPVFAPGNTNYTATEANAMASITVTPTTAVSGSTVYVNGTLVTSGTASAAIPLNFGANTITVMAIAQDGVTIKNYKIAVTRTASANASLSNLIVSTGTFSPAFAATTTAYTENVPYATTSITVTPTLADPTATIKVNGTSVASGTASAAIPLNPGNNPIAVVVTAQDGTTTLTYTLTVKRVTSTNAKLSSLATSAGVLSPAFNNTVYSYTRAVPNTTTSITITPTTADATATVTVNSVAVTSGSPSGSIALVAGANVINTVVTAQDGTTKLTYTITVNRAGAADATLSNLAISVGTLKPTFVSTTTAYSVAVGNATASVTVTPTTNDPNATVKVNGVAVTSGSASGAITLVVGANTITTVVTAQNGATTKSYKITVTRAASTNAKLLSLTTSAGVLSPAFNNAVTSYTRSVPNATTSITFTPTVVDKTATITVNGTATASGTASAAQTLAVGSNVENIKVTAQDGVTTITYVVTVTRASGGANTVYEPVSVEKPLDNPQLAADGINVHEGISPNGDGINDFLVIENIANYPDNQLRIMNRSGQLVFEAKNYDNSSKIFDGHSNKNGAMQLPGTYFYSLDYTVKGVAKHKTGYIVLKY